MSMYEEMKKRRQMDLEHSIKELEYLADTHKDHVHFLSQECYKKGVLFAIREIEGTERLLTKAHKELPYANPEEAEREYNNQMNVLKVLKGSLINRHKGKP